MAGLAIAFATGRAERLAPLAWLGLALGIIGVGALVGPDVGARAEAGGGLAAARVIVERVLPLPGVRGLHLMPLGAKPEDLAELAAHARGHGVTI
jgi:hypothetical protein